MPRQVVAKSCNAAPARNSVSEPLIGTARTPCTTTISEKAVATRTTIPIDQTLEIMISSGVTGITKRCSMVPCSRSRIRAAPVRIIESIVTDEMTLVIAPNHPLFRS
ncbi:hypothetical protein D3C72_2299580 [compost metagenome]